MSLINRITGVFTKSFSFWPTGQVPEVSIFSEVSSGSLGSKLSVLVRSLWSAMMTTLTLEKYHTLTACQGSPDKKRLNKSALRGKKRPSGAIKLQQAAIRWETPFHIQLSQQCPWPSLILNNLCPLHGAPSYFSEFPLKYISACVCLFKIDIQNMDFKQNHSHWIVPALPCFVNWYAITHWSLNIN